MSTLDVNKIDFEKSNLIPAIVQDAKTLKVLMLGYMNKEAVLKTLETKKVTFFSRSKKRIWTKGEESGNFLNLVGLVACVRRTSKRNLFSLIYDW